MRSIFIIRYKMRAGKLDLLTVYALTTQEALRKFHHRMASEFGCDGNYRVVSIRAIRENRIITERHANFIDQLDRGDRAELFNDRRTRQLQKMGRVEKYVSDYFQKQREKVFA